ncbi:hypothetical protein [Chryseobacterium sp. 3008163]|uniref:hypothetical protein n=1 Tax=Chryseobacterium sp. 3008163 TaxID=2478663 RepID=UPI0013EB3566|nr:hypothetical protein [Chryseobacterium sp. 3008163]
MQGHKLEIIKIADEPARSFIWIPSIKAVVGGINVFGNDFHLWTANDATVIKRDM